MLIVYCTRCAQHGQCLEAGTYDTETASKSHKLRADPLLCGGMFRIVRALCFITLGYATCACVRAPVRVHFAEPRSLQKRDL